MRLVGLLGHRRRLLMQFDPSKNTASPSLKRSFAQQANVARKLREEYPSETKHLKLEDAPSRASSSSGIPLTKGPYPLPVSSKMPSSGPRTPKNLSSRIPRSASSASSFRFPSKGKGKFATSSTSNSAVFELPARDRDFILHEHRSKSQHLPPIKAVYEENPKSPLSNFFCTHMLGKIPEYQSVLGVYPDRPDKIWR